MTVSAKIIADSITSEGKRLTTFELRYPRFIHAEELTHRVLSTEPNRIYYENVPDGLMYDKDLSRNASSSRAIPVEKMIEDLQRDPAMPVFWGSNKPGMQAGDELTGADQEYCRVQWLNCMDAAINYARAMIKRGLHKQIANRVLEPWAHINVVVTATEWTNFFALRCHSDAQPEINELAAQMRALMEYSEPQLLEPHQWHLPYFSDDDIPLLREYYNDIIAPNEGYPNGFFQESFAVHSDHHGWWLKGALMLSVARCASVSYKTVDGSPMTVERAIKLYDRLLGATPIHASPAEHQARPDEITGTDDFGDKMWACEELHGNFDGWVQHRKLLPNENIQ